MNDSRIRSPEQNLKKSQIISSPNNNSKSYLPSRHAQQKKTQKVGFQDILNSIQAKTSGEMFKSKAEGSPKLKPINNKLQDIIIDKKPKTSHFKSRPMKRQKNDQLQFNEIFLNPRQEALEQLRKKSCVEQNIKTISKQYEKLLKFQQMGANSKNQQDKTSEQKIIKQSYDQVIQMLESGAIFGINIKSNDNDFYDNHISIQPPDFPSGSTSQSTSPSSYAPSIPSNYKTTRSLNIKQLLMRARAGMSGEDVEKQAHLSYFLGEVYSEKRMFEFALKFYRRYLGFAKAMEDVIGMSLGANRVAISYFNCGQTEKSIMFHNENLKLSNNDNCFVGFYNIGICYRRLNKLEEALQYFESALNWAQEKGEQESECIALGQIGVTYLSMQLFEQSILKFERSNEICNKIKKEDLKLHNLRYILRISSTLHLRPTKQIEKIVEQAFICAQQNSGLKMLDIFRCNLGIVRGIQELENLNLNTQLNEIQEI